MTVMHAVCMGVWRAMISGNCSPPSEQIAIQREELDKSPLREPFFQASFSPFPFHFRDSARPNKTDDGDKNVSRRVQCIPHIRPMILTDEYQEDIIAVRVLG